MGTKSEGTVVVWVPRVRGQWWGGYQECGDSGGVGTKSGGTVVGWVPRVRGQWWGGYQV